MGGFDALFFAHHEEIDLCWRLQLNGYKIMVCPQSVVFHVGGGTLPVSPHKLFLNHRNNLIVLIKNLPLIQKLFLLPIRIIADICIPLTYLFKLQFKLFIVVYRAYFAVISLGLQGKIIQSKNVRKISQLSGVYKGSLIAAYYLLGKKIFSKLIPKN
jgi:GT2 family glycosyltransferase